VRINVVSRVVAVIGVIGLLVPVAQAGLGNGGGTPPGSPNGGAYSAALECRVIEGGNLPLQLQLQDNYGFRFVQVNSGRLICTVVTLVQPPLSLPVDAPGPNSLKCYAITSVQNEAPTPSKPALFKDDGFDVTELVNVNDPRYLCVPATVVQP
jgi:hypothetical protein